MKSLRLSVPQDSLDSRFPQSLKPQMDVVHKAGSGIISNCIIFLRLQEAVVCQSLQFGYRVKRHGKKDACFSAIRQSAFFAFSISNLLAMTGNRIQSCHTKALLATAAKLHHTEPFSQSLPETCHLDDSARDARLSCRHASRNPSPNHSIWGGVPVLDI